MMATFNIADWTWHVAERDAYWKSATREWVAHWDGPCTRLGTEAELVAMFERILRPELAPLNANHIRRECQRRMMVLAGARDAADFSIKLTNAIRETCRLQDVVLRGGKWTPEQTQRAAQLRAADAAIEHLRARSNAMEAAPPADFASDARWA